MLLVCLNVIHGKSSVPREEPKGASRSLPPFLLVVKIWAVHLATPSLILIPTLVNAEIIWMVFLLFPPVAISAAVLQPAPIIIRQQILLCVPILALIFRVVKLERFPPEILPIMSIYADFALVIFI